MARKKEPHLVNINQSKIITVAKSLFSENGLVNTKVDDIAREAGMSKSTFYVYFKSKDDVKNHISLEAIRYLYENIAKEISKNKTDFYNTFISICYLFVDFKERYPINYHLIMEEISVDDNDLQEDSVLRDIYETGEDLNRVVFLYLKEELNIDDETELFSLVFFILANIFGVCLMADNKEKYIQKAIKKSKQEFFQYSFDNLFKLLKERSSL